MKEHLASNLFNQEYPDEGATDSSRFEPGINHISARNIINIPGDDGKVLIECPGATLYREGSNEIIAGVKFFDNDDPSQGFEIIGKTVYGIQHVRYRWVKKENVHLIRRCQSCQDYTIRMRRKEGPDLYIPSRKNPRPKSSRRSSGRSTENRP